MSWRIDPQETGLLVVDIQERLLPVIRHGEAVAARAAVAVKVARLFNLPVFHTEQVPHKLGPTVPVVREALGDNQPPAPIKTAFSSADCYAPGELPRTLIVVGIETHVCVRQTVFDLRERGHEIYLLADAVSSRSETDHRLALHELREIVKARVTTLEAIAWEMLGKAEGEPFKKLLTLLK